MKKGPGKFYEKYKKEIEEGLKGNQEAIAQIKTQQIKIAALLKEDPKVLENKKKIWDMQVNYLIKEFEKFGGFEIQSKK